jgi:hypothetical protein
MAQEDHSGSERHQDCSPNAQEFEPTAASSRSAWYWLWSTLACMIAITHNAAVQADHAYKLRSSRATFRLVLPAHPYRRCSGVLA